MAAGMALIGGGVLWATQVPVHGHFWSALAGPFFVAGAGTALGFVPISIAGLAGVAEREAGLASGLINAAQQIGGAIGVSIASTVAFTHEKISEAREILRNVGAGRLHVTAHRDAEAVVFDIEEHRKLQRRRHRE